MNTHQPVLFRRMKERLQSLDENNSRTHRGHGAWVTRPFRCPATSQRGRDAALRNSSNPGPRQRVKRPTSPLVNSFLQSLGKSQGRVATSPGSGPALEAGTGGAILDQDA